MEDANISVEYIRSSDLATNCTKENPNFTGLKQGKHNFTYGYDKVCTALLKAYMK